jgi:hypothetical protein
MLQAEHDPVTERQDIDKEGVTAREVLCSLRILLESPGGLVSVTFFHPYAVLQRETAFTHFADRDNRQLLLSLAHRRGRLYRGRIGAFLSCLISEGRYLSRHGFGTIVSGKYRRRLRRGPPATTPRGDGRFLESGYVSTKMVDGFRFLGAFI